MFLAFAFCAAMVWPRTAAAVTVEQIVALSKSGVSEAVILALLDRDKTILSIEPDQLVALKRAGLSDSLLMAMLKNGREEGEEAARAISDAKAASILATLPISSYTPAPDFVVVGHGPDYPNTSYGNRTFYSPSAGYSVRRGFSGDRYGEPGSLGVFVPPYTGSLKCGAGPPSWFDYPRGDRVLCLAQVTTAQGRGPSYVTECPTVMQPYRGR